MNIQQILADAKLGELPSCRECPWSPAREDSVGFGVSCTVHGIDWHQDQDVNSMIVVQDPGDTTPHQTGRLCAVHNAMNPSDKTAQQNLQLWNAAVSLSHDDPQAHGYLKKHYWTNAIMHGASGDTGLRKKHIMEQARQCCTSVLAMQIEALQPNVIIAKGIEAVNSLHDIGILSAPWPGIRHTFSKGAYREAVSEWKGLPAFTVYATYHTSARVVNQTLSRMYDEDKTEAYIENKLNQIGSPDSVKQFKAHYDNPKSNARARGMRFLLNHWLDIGVAIRDGMMK